MTTSTGALDIIAINRELALPDSQPFNINSAVIRKLAGKTQVNSPISWQDLQGKTAFRITTPPSQGRDNTGYLYATFTVTAPSHSSGFTWAVLSGGAAISSGQNTNQVTIRKHGGGDNQVDGSVRCVVTNSHGISRTLTSSYRFRWLDFGGGDRPY